MMRYLGLVVLLLPKVVFAASLADWCGPSGGSIACYSLDEATGTRVNRQGTTDNDLTIVTGIGNDTSIKVEGTASNTFDVTHALGCSTGKCVNLSSGLTAFTVMARVYPTDLSTPNYFLFGNLASSGNNNGFFSVLGSGGGVSGFLYSGGAYNDDIFVLPMVINAWHHIALSFSGGTFKIYGKRGASTNLSSTHTGKVMGVTDSVFHLSDGVGGLAGKLDEVIVFPDAIDAASICRVCSCLADGSLCTRTGTAFDSGAGNGLRVSDCGSCTLPSDASVLNPLTGATPGAPTATPTPTPTKTATPTPTFTAGGPTATPSPHGLPDVCNKFTEVLHLEEAINTRFNAEGDGNNNLTLVSTVTNDANHKEGSFSNAFDGTNSLSCNATSVCTELGLSLTSFTALAWVRPTTLAAGPYSIMGNRNQAGNGNGFWMHVASTGSFNAFLYNNGNYSDDIFVVGGGGPGAVNTWSHAATSYNQFTKDFKLYGKTGAGTNLSATHSNKIMAASNGPLFYLSGLSEGLPFVGQIDDAMVYPAELTAQRICRICSCGCGDGTGFGCDRIGNEYNNTGLNTTDCGSCSLGSGLASDDFAFPATPTATPTPTSTGPTATPTLSPTPTATKTPTPTVSVTQTGGPTATPTPIPTFTPGGGGQAYYVNPNSVSCAADDARAGTSPALAWCTVPGTRTITNLGFLRSAWGAVTAATKIQPHDTIFIRPGTFTSSLGGALRIDPTFYNNSASAAVPITIRVASNADWGGTVVKKCVGGTNATAACLVDSTCPGGTCRGDVFFDGTGIELTSTTFGRDRICQDPGHINYGLDCVSTADCGGGPCASHCLNQGKCALIDIEMVPGISFSGFDASQEIKISNVVKPAAGDALGILLYGQNPYLTTEDVLGWLDITGKVTSLGVPVTDAGGAISIGFSSQIFVHDVYVHQWRGPGMNTGLTAAKTVKGIGFERILVQDSGPNDLSVNTSSDAFDFQTILFDDQSVGGGGLWCTDCQTINNQTTGSNSGGSNAPYIDGLIRFLRYKAIDNGRIVSGIISSKVGLESGGDAVHSGSALPDQGLWLLYPTFYTNFAGGLAPGHGAGSTYLWNGTFFRAGDQNSNFGYDACTDYFEIINTVMNAGTAAPMPAFYSGTCGLFPMSNNKQLPIVLNSFFKSSSDANTFIAFGFDSFCVGGGNAGAKCRQNSGCPGGVCTFQSGVGTNYSPNPPGFMLDPSNKLGNAFNYGFQSTGGNCDTVMSLTCVGGPNAGANCRGAGGFPYDSVCPGSFCAAPLQTGYQDCNFNLQSNSALIDAGTFLFRANGASSGTTVKVRPPPETDTAPFLGYSRPHRGDPRSAFLSPDAYPFAQGSVIQLENANCTGSVVEFGNPAMARVAHLSQTGVCVGGPTDGAACSHYYDCYQLNSGDCRGTCANGQTNCHFDSDCVVPPCGSKTCKAPLVSGIGNPPTFGNSCANNRDCVTAAALASYGQCGGTITLDRACAVADNAGIHYPWNGPRPDSNSIEAPGGGSPFPTPTATPTATKTPTPTPTCTGSCSTPTPGNCCSANAAPGCTNLLCQACVCQALVQPGCCSVGWFSLCAVEATDPLCNDGLHATCDSGPNVGIACSSNSECPGGSCLVYGGCGCPTATPTVSPTPTTTRTATPTRTPTPTATPTTSPTATAETCCSPHNAPGCDNPSCESCVCGVNPVCCSSSWSSAVGCYLIANDPGFCGAYCPECFATVTPTPTPSPTHTPAPGETATPTANSGDTPTPTIMATPCPNCGGGGIIFPPAPPPESPEASMCLMNYGIIFDGTNTIHADSCFNAVELLSGNANMSIVCQEGVPAGQPDICTFTVH